MSINKKLYSRSFFIANLVIIGIVLGFALAFMGRSGKASGGSQLPLLNAQSAPFVQVSPETGAALSQAEAVQKAFRYVAETVSPSVVEVDVTEKLGKNSPQNSIPPFFFFNPDGGSDEDEGGNAAPYRSSGLGSGVIVRRDGDTVYVLTNSHVAGNAETIKVSFPDGREFSAKLVGKDDRKDIALIKFDTKEKDIVVARLGDSSAMQVGDWAIAFGSPLGLISSMTTGVVSAVGRSGGPGNNINDFIQTDAAINRGNSGGALANIRGEVIGINTWIASNTGGSEGLGFAIPINNIKSAIDDFINHGKIKYGWLGVSLSGVMVDKASAKELGVEGVKGGFVSDVFVKGPADNAGILPGDYIISFNGKDIKTSDELVRAVGDLPAGSTAPLGLIRNGKRLDLKVKITERDTTVASSAGANVFPGTTVISLSSDQVDKNKVPAGVSGVLAVNVQARSPAASMGLKNGDIITAVNNTRIRTVGEFYAAINDASAKKLTFTVNRDGQSLETLAYVKK